MVGDTARSFSLGAEAKHSPIVGNGEFRYYTGLFSPLNGPGRLELSI